MALESLAERISVEAASGVYRPLKPSFLEQADVYLSLHEKIP